MELNTAKNVGGVGALLMFIGAFPFVNQFGILGLVGLILLMIGAKGLADNYNAPGIFENALYGIITVIVGVVVAAALAFIAFVKFFNNVGLRFSNFSSWQTMISQVSRTQWRHAFFNAAGYIFLTVAVFFVFAVVSAIFFRKSLMLSASKTGVRLFATAAIVLLVGAILTIVIFGAILLWISLLLVAIAFFQITAEPTQQQPQTQTMQPT